MALADATAKQHRARCRRSGSRYRPADTKRRASRFPWSAASPPTKNQGCLSIPWSINHCPLKVLAGRIAHIAGIPRFKRGLHEGVKAMPQIDVHLIKGVFNAEQKKQIIHKLTDAMVSIEGENMRGVTWVKIFEVNSGEWGIGGQPLTTEAVKDLAAGRHAA
jgi:4-oxalocrotonate tautomerase